MAKLKNIAIIVFAVLMLLGVCAISAGCSDDKKQTEEEITGTFYSLQEAYDQELLTTENLQTIADYHNNGIPYPENINEEIAKSLKKVWAKNLSESKNDTSSELTEEDVSIVKYYGIYNRCAIVIVEKWGSTYIQVYAPYTVEIGNVTFNYNYPRPEIVVYKY